MKSNILVVFLLTILSIGMLPLHAEYTAPTEGQLDKMMANPKLVVSTIKGADAKQAAALLKRVIDRVMASNLNTSQRTYAIAYYTARFTFLLPASEINAFATELIPMIPPEAMPAVLSGFALGGGGSSDFINHVREIIQDNDVYVAALTAPRSSLTNPIHDLLARALSASQTLPPSVTSSLPPAIDATTGEDEETTTPPPVPETYDGQG